jgi:transposase
MKKTSTGKRARGVQEPFWRSELEAWRRSGLSQATYQRKHRLSKNAFTYWKRKLEGSRRTRVTFAAVPRQTVRAAALHDGAGVMRLRVGGSYEVELSRDFETTSLERLLTVLERRAG